MNIVFAGTPDFAVASLQALQQSDHNISAVYTQPDRPAGRGRKLLASPVKQFAVEHGFEVHQPTTLKDQTEIDALAAIKPDVMIVVAYGLILPQTILDIPRLGCLNVHASLLPRWRGAAPIQRAIEAGDPHTGVTIMQMEAGLDTGPMLLKKELTINADDTAATLHDRLAKLGAEALLGVLHGLENGSLKVEKQNDADAKYADKLSKLEADIDWSQSATVIERKARAFNPYPMLNTHWQGKRLRILKATKLDCAPGTSRAAGDVCDISNDGFTVATGEACLLIQRVQLEGKKPQSATDFLNGHTLKIGDQLGQTNQNQAT